MIACDEANHNYNDNCNYKYDYKDDGNNRGCPLVVHYWADWQSMHELHCYDNIAPNVKYQRVLVFTLCLVRYWRHIDGVKKTMPLPLEISWWINKG